MGVPPIVNPGWPQRQHALLHSREKSVHADSGYTGVAKREEIVKAQADGRIFARGPTGTWLPSAARSSRWPKACSRI